MTSGASPRGLETRKWLWLLALCGCQSRDKEPPKPTTPDAGFVHPQVDARIVDVAPTDWEQCKKALEAAPKTPPMRRVQMLLGACRPCGDWKPLLEWSKLDGGPTRTQIEDSMLACKAYCNSDAKVRFLGTIDKFRGKDTRGPWRFLGDLCKAEVSAVPDNRYASAPFFALDRIARAAGERPELAGLLDKFELTLPVVSTSGYGYELAKSPVTAPHVGPLALTVTPNEIRIATVSRAKLTKDGVVTLTEGESYPGALIKTAADLDAAVAKLAANPAGPPGADISIFAPHAMPASRLLDALVLTGERPRALLNQKPGKVWLPGVVNLAVQVDGGPPGWQLSGSIPVALRTTADAAAIQVDLDDDPDPVIEKLKGDKAKLMGLIAKQQDAPPEEHAPATKLVSPMLAIHLGPKATVDGLAKLIGAAAYFDVKSVALLKGKVK